jgi:hypothetical protein
VSGSHRLICCTPDELFDIVQACCAEHAEQSGEGARGRLRGRRPARSDRRLLTDASANVEPPRRAQLVSITRFGQSHWEVTCDQGANGSIAHLQLQPTQGVARWLPRNVRNVYAIVVGDRILQRLDEYAAGRATQRPTGPQSRSAAA